MRILRRFMRDIAVQVRRRWMREMREEDSERLNEGRVMKLRGKRGGKKYEVCGVKNLEDEPQMAIAPSPEETKF